MGRSFCAADVGGASQTALAQGVYHMGRASRTASSKLVGPGEEHLPTDVRLAIFAD